MRDEQAELGVIGSRYRWLVAVVLVVMILLGIRFATLQMIDHDLYASRAEDNRIKLQALPPNRGLILDRHGQVLAENLPAYRLVIVPERTEVLTETLDELSALVEVSSSERERFERQRQRSRRFEAVTLKTNLDEEQVSRLAIHRHRLPGVEIEPYLTRHYPHGPELAHVIGYVGRIDQRDLQRLPVERYRGTTHVGKTGIEHQYESVLHGHPGLERVETNAQGRVLRVLERSAPEPGENLSLTIDLSLQQAAVEALGDHAGAVVLLDVASGDVLALVSQPGFDPNLFVHGIRSNTYNALLSDRHRPLFNRFLSGAYEPGSTIKPFLSLAGLETGAVTPNTQVFSGGHFQLPGHSRRYRDWRRGGHGWVDLEAALAESVNVYYYQLAVELGIDQIARELALFGFGRATGLDLPGESDGVLPTRSWKRAVFNEPWFPGETVITGIGQGFVVVTPLQLAHATAALAGRGRTAAPTLVGNTEPVQMVAHGAAHWDAVFDGMAAVVHGDSGTARAIADMLPTQIAGKTGTAQVFGRPNDDQERALLDEDALPEQLRNHALFMGFAPLHEPRIALSVVVEHGGGGASVAAPVAAQVMARALELGY
ncbi:penicillin-binding protein 2 [Wenzhouxiangella sp. C33]|uniref:Peptidoglycan D,D-transpeptidase MrdA n=2 Tax=Wenzhouxiangella limi TaxID=2707351 RepID=A0A845UYE7_9GAMM|nr:penicillin-binding protein 2 [Wenzhouxiangella limi]